MDDDDNAGVNKSFVSETKTDHHQGISYVRCCSSMLFYTAESGLMGSQLMRSHMYEALKSLTSKIAS